MNITGFKIHLVVGKFQVVRCPGFWIESERHAPLTRGGITLPDPKGRLFQSIQEGEPVNISLGYRNQAPAEWKGTVAWLRPGTGKDQVEIGVVGNDLPLTATRLTQAFENEAPEAIVRWAIIEAGLTPGRIESPGVIFPRCVVSDIPVWQVARQCCHTCTRAFGLDMREWALWMGADKTVNWGPFDEPGQVPVIASGANLIQHSPDSEAVMFNQVETFLLPAMRHSMRFRLTDARRGVDGTFRAVKVRHSMQETKIRTFLLYGEDHEQY
jgi:hypothetical protein